MAGVDSGRAPANQTALHFSRGGDQGGEGEGVGAEFYIENVLEELDEENEFFFDEERRVLYYKVNSTDPNGTAHPGGSGGAAPGRGGAHPAPAAADFVATRHAVLFNVSGESRCVASRLLRVGGRGPRVGVCGRHGVGPGVPLGARAIL